MKKLIAKLGKMRKETDWVVYPFNPATDTVAQIQSDKYIARIDLTSGKGILAGPHANGAYNHHFLTGPRQVIQVDPAMIQEIKDCNPKPGSTIGGGVVIIGHS